MGAAADLGLRWDSPGLTPASPQTTKIRGFAAKGKMQDEQWKYESAAAKIGNFDSLFVAEQQQPRASAGLTSVQRIPQYIGLGCAPAYASPVAVAVARLITILCEIAFMQTRVTSVSGHALH